MDVITQIIEEKSFHLTARRGILSLLEKPKKDVLRIKNWCPLTLLNIDNKIYTKVLANRLQSVFNTIIHPSQTGFVKGRHLADNILKIQEVMEEFNSKRMNGVLISFDFEKAFDTVEWKTIETAMKAVGFGEKFIEMSRIIFDRPEAYILNNSFWSNPIYPTHGCRQGCCYSPSAFNLAVEILGIAIRQNKEIRGISLHETIIKAGQFADDLWTVTQASLTQVNEILKELDNYAKFSGLHVNPEKCAILRIGPWHDTDAKFYTLKKLFWSPGSIRILGILIHPEVLVMYHENFIDMLELVEVRLLSWHNRNLSLIGKVTVVNTLINTLLIHKLLALPTPDAVFFKVV